ncbi:unnamed protein product [Arabis nemorensis]|uniref:Secreted protein n=1 Tax=Arabis nemorensis TaxID=586526 RepID=A0A565BAY8_9BRAS|nr:unnamed protein product [Arabis nemorensis]
MVYHLRLLFVHSLLTLPLLRVLYRDLLSVRERRSTALFSINHLTSLESSVVAHQGRIHNPVGSDSATDYPLFSGTRSRRFDYGSRNLRHSRPISGFHSDSDPRLERHQISWRVGWLSKAGFRLLFSPIAFRRRVHPPPVTGYGRRYCHRQVEGLAPVDPRQATI